jgi:hypothetical protein
VKVLGLINKHKVENYKIYKKMELEKIILRINENHQSFIDYISHLSKAEFEFRKGDKWTAGQHLAHIVLALKATLNVFSMDKSIIQQNFGRTERQSRSYEVLQSDYQKKTIGGGKAPIRFIPETITIDQEQSLIEKLTYLTKELGLQIGTFSEQELNSLLIPHPLLGDVTLREMLYNVAYHVEHHQLQAIANFN